MDGSMQGCLGKWVFRVDFPKIAENRRRPKIARGLSISGSSSSSGSGDWVCFEEQRGRKNSTYRGMKEWAVVAPVPRPPYTLQCHQEIK